MISYQVLRRLCLFAVTKPVYQGRVISACGLKTSTVNHSDKQPDPVVTYEQLKAMLANHSVQLFDVRNPDEFQAGRIPDSTNIPLGQLEESLKLPPQQFEVQFKVKAPKKEDDNIVFHCRSGKRSLSALEIAHRLGFIKARHYAGGYIDWEAHEK
ncbi:thiosulfate:glutathione sulfurtransferase isoform X1 [Xyrauchen texanus]|uniref:thiosulfate:glutathione sulfurtransferase isoform X1 n=1 Tax=Xyrauchen texanus TaxID=154827 RepID=UPI002242499F|nr:thiosulfate:glutathione sulfurtransferase isoform X1 [Xyrauchen texanus]